MSNVVVEFDRPRTLTYLWTDARLITSRLGGLTMVELINKLGATQPDVLQTCLFIGLGNEDRKLTFDKVTPLIQGYIDKGGQLGTLVNAVLEALQEDGLVGRREPGDEKADPRTP